MSDLSIREQRALLRAARAPGPGPIELFKPHETLGELERLFRCQGCGGLHAVGPCWEHIDPEAYVGIECGCWERLHGPLPVWPVDESGEVCDGAGTVGNGQEGPS